MNKFDVIQTENKYKEITFFYKVMERISDREFLI